MDGEIQNGLIMKKRLKSFLQNVSLFMISSLVILIICEIIVRVFMDQTAYTVSSYPEKMFDSKSKTLLRANFKGQFAPGEYSASIKINSLGLRDSELKKEDSEVKILGLGDSFTFGHGVESQESFLKLLEKKLIKTQDNHIKVLNAGIPGTGPDKYVNVYNHLEKKYHPDHVLFCLFIGNDLTDLNITSKSKNKSKPTKKADNSGSSIKTFLRKNIHLYSFIVDRAKTIPAVRKFLVKSGIAHGLIGNYIIDILKPRLTNEYKDRWATLFDIIKETKNKNKNFTVILIPTREQVYPLRLNKAIKQLGYAADEIDIYFPNKKINDYCDSLEIDCIDLMPKFIAKAKKENLYFEIDPHFNKYGHKLASQIIFNQLNLNLK